MSFHSAALFICAFGHRDGVYLLPEGFLHFMEIQALKSAAFTLATSRTDLCVVLTKT